MQLLCVADAHIGRYPTRVPEKDERLTIRSVWQASVDYAVEHRVDAVVLTGDMVDQDSHYFEAFGEIRRGLARLSQASIPVVAVSGNHDHDVFPRLVESMADADITLLGPQGTWTRKRIISSSGLKASFVGWSFPSAHFAGSPLDSFPDADRQELTIGVVHGDLDPGSGSPYAPINSGRMQELSVDLWLLGHVHKPYWFQGPQCGILYPGSLQAMDPGETGPHGPWLISVAPDRSTKPEQVPLATVRYERMEVDVSSVSHLDDAKQVLAESLGQRTRQLAASHPALRHVSYRPVLQGRTRAHTELVVHPPDDAEDLAIAEGQLEGSVDQLQVDTKPVLDLDKIARFDDPLGILAKWILELERNEPSEELDEIREEAGNAMLAVDNSVAFRGVRDSAPPDADDIRSLVMNQAELLLDRLMHGEVPHG